MIARYPKPDDFQDAAAYEPAANQMNALMELIKAVRNIRGETSLSPGLKIPLIVQADDASLAELIQRETRLVKELARIEQLDIVDNFGRTGPVASGVCPGARIFVPLHDLIDLAQERKRLSLQLEKTRKEFQKAENKLQNENFLSRAPEDIVQKQKDQRKALRMKIEKLEKNLEMLA